MGIRRGENTMRSAKFIVACGVTTGAILATHSAALAQSEIADHLDQLPTDKDAAVVLYCRSGPMSVRAATALAGLGYTRVYSLVGGFNAWGRAGLPMVNP